MYCTFLAAIGNNVDVIYQVYVRFYLPFCSLAVPIIPEFLYAIRHQHDRFTTPRITSTTTTSPQTPFGFNETYYGDPAVLFDSMEENDNAPPAPAASYDSSSTDDYQDYGEMDESELTPEQK